MNFKRLLVLTGTILSSLTLVWMCLFFLSGPPESARAAGDTYTVCPTGPCDYNVIQDAVDAAENGDVIKVAAGTYDDVNNHGGLAQVVYIVKSVTIQGGYTTAFTEPPDPDANPTILDAGDLGRVIYIEGNIAPAVKGFRITGGNANVSEPVLGGTGGGAQVYDAAATFRDNQIFNNTAYDGGGVRLDNSAATLEENNIFSNTADNGGGGLFLSFSPATLSGNDISDNVAGLGGGMFIDYSTAILNNNTIVSNTAVNGGGLSINQSDDIRLSANTIISNTANYGGGVRLDYSAATLINNMIINNHADFIPSGILVGTSTAYLLHNTITSNRNDSETGIWVDEDSTIAITNTIIVSHTIGILVDGVATIESTLWGDGIWANGTNWAGGGTIIPTNDHSGNPDFVDYLAGDYHIGENSDAIDAGIDAGVTTDIDGSFRPYQLPDIGADEYWPPGALKFIYLPLVIR